MKNPASTIRRAASLLLTAAAFALISFCARADEVDRISLLERVSARAAGMGGAFTAIPGGDPSAMFWNPAAAVSSNRLAFSHTHSLRHFPGGKKNLDQFDSDTACLSVPLANDHMLGLGFTVPGEWGYDYADTNGLLERDKDASLPARVRGRERRAALADMYSASGKGLGAAEAYSDWYRSENKDRSSVSRRFHTGAGFSIFYQDDNGFHYGVNIRAHRVKKSGEPGRYAGSVKLGMAYRANVQADTIAALDVELKSGDDGNTSWLWAAGLERKYEDKAFARMGFLNGLPTYGLGARFSHVRFDYATVHGLLPPVAGQNPGKFTDGHFASYTITD